MKTLLALLGMVFAMTCGAQLRCDCSEQIGNCRASAVHHNGLLELTTDTSGCAQVLFYIDGQPRVALVTDGRTALPEHMQAFQQLQAGECRVCRELPLSAQQRQGAVQQCAADLLMPTDATRHCIDGCSQHPQGDQRRRCELDCQRHSRCLEAHCVELLRDKLSACQRRCDRDMQSSMVADIDAYRQCQTACATIKTQILSCPVL